MRPMEADGTGGIHDAEQIRMRDILDIRPMEADAELGRISHVTARDHIQIQSTQPTQPAPPNTYSDHGGLSRNVGQRHERANG